jgi:hypothetical protein
MDLKRKRRISVQDFCIAIEGRPTMTRWNLLSSILLQSEYREAIGKAWPLFFLLIFKMKKENKYVANYAELKECLNENPHTIKAWREHLDDHKVVEVFKGSTSMSFVLLPPYASLVTCEQDDETQIKLVGDPATKQLLDKVKGYGEMPFLALLPVITDLTSKINNLEKKIG